MTIKVNASEIVEKQLSALDGNPFQLEDVTAAMQRGEVQPKLLTALLDAETNSEFLQTDTFKYDETKASAQLPSGKAYSDHGPDLKKDKAKQFRYAVPSFGQRFNVAPTDYIGRRKPGTINELLTEADVLAAMSMKSDVSWDLFNELAIAQLITTDTNIVRGGPHASYNFYTDIHGGARPAAIDMDLGNAAEDHISLFRKQRKLQAQELARVGDSAAAQIVICGDTFFNKRYEIEVQESLPRELRSTFDLASQAVPTISDGNYRYDNFTSHDGLIYINYGAEIIAGTKLIDDANAYMIPLGASNLLRRAYAPAQTRTYANTQALPLYADMVVNDRTGVTVATESNVLFANVNPKSITWLTSST